MIDDALSAVDAHVAKHLFEEALLGELFTSNTSEDASKRSVVLITNALQYLNHPRVTKIIVVEHGKIIEEGTYSVLAGDPNSVFARYMSVIEQTGVSKQAPANSPSNDIKSSTIKDSRDIGNTTLIKKDSKVSKLMTEEGREKGQVGMDVYIAWANAAGGLIIPIIVVIVFVLVESMSVLSNWWLTYWSAHGDSGKSQFFFLGVYAAISLSTAIAGLFRMILVSYFGLRASRNVRYCLKIAIYLIDSNLITFF